MLLFSWVRRLFQGGCGAAGGPRRVRGLWLLVVWCPWAGGGTWGGWGGGALAPAAGPGWWACRRLRRSSVCGSFAGALHVIIDREVASRSALELVDVGRIRLNLNLIARWRKGQNPEPAITSSAILLVVGHERIDPVSIKNVCSLTFRRRHVPTEHQKEIWISFQRVVCCLPLRTPCRIKTIIDQVVADYDAAPGT